MSILLVGADGLLLAGITAPTALAFGFAGASAARSRVALCHGWAEAISPWCAACPTLRFSCFS